MTFSLPPDVNFLMCNPGFAFSPLPLAQTSMLNTYAYRPLPLKDIFSPAFVSSSPFKKPRCATFDPRRVLCSRPGEAANFFFVNRDLRSVPSCFFFFFWFFIRVPGSPLPPFAIRLLQDRRRLDPSRPTPRPFPVPPGRPLPPLHFHFWPLYDVPSRPRSFPPTL